MCRGTWDAESQELSLACQLALTMAGHLVSALDPKMDGLLGYVLGDLMGDVWAPGRGGLSAHWSKKVSQWAPLLAPRSVVSMAYRLAYG